MKLPSVGVLLLFALAASFALFRLTESPSVWYDEGIYIQAAQNIEQMAHNGLQLAPGIFSSSAHITVGYPLLYPLAAVFAVFGRSILHARLLMVAFILGFLVVSYVLARRLFGPGVALGALALLATLPTLYGNGKSVLGEVPGLFFFVLALLCFERARATRSLRTFVLAGFFVGLAIATKPLFLLIVPAALVAWAVSYQSLKLTLKEVAGVAAAALVPILFWLWTQFGGQDSFGATVGFYANPYGIRSLFSTILQNALHLITSPDPLYLSLVLVLWVAALWIRKTQRENIAPEEMITFVFAVLVVLAFLRTAGWYRYLFPAQAVALLYVPKALITIFAYAASRIPVLSQKIRSLAVISIVIMLSLFGGYSVLFSSWTADYYGSHKTAFWETYFVTVPETNTLFFYNIPEVVPFSHSRNYYQYLNPAGGAIGADSLAVLDAGIPDKVFVEEDSWEGGKNTAFAKYQVEQTVYKCVILTRKSK